MARLSVVGASAPDPTSINLTRLLSRLQQTLLRPDAATEQRLRKSNYERSKVGTNLEYARTLLLRLEQDASSIKVQSKRLETQTELLQKRDIILQLSERLQDLADYGQESDEDSSEGEDLLGEDTPSDDIDDNDTPPEQSFEDQFQAPSSTFIAVEPPQLPPQATEREQREQLFPSELRSRHSQAQASSQLVDTAQTTSSNTAITSTTEKLLSHNRTEQESLTESLLSMAQALKSSSQAFSSSLESEKDVLGRATDGLDRNTSGLDAAHKRMGYLRRMTEGRGWWGRMMMYAWIFGLMFVALFIVGFLPKLRF